MEFWTRGEAPTFQKFARSWTKAKAEQHRLVTAGVLPYLTDRKHHRADSEWKAVRKAKGKSALETGESRPGLSCEGAWARRATEQDYFSVINQMFPCCVVREK